MSSQDDTDAASRLWWGLRRFLPAVVAAAVLGGLIGGVLAPRAQKERWVAPALVVVERLGDRGEMRSLAEQLPHYAQAVFRNGRVAERAVNVGQLPYEPDELVRRHVRLEPVENTLAVRVAGVADEPALAARVANSVADALVRSMNTASPELATFKVQSRASAPDDPEPGRSATMGGLIGVLAGLALGVGCVALYMMVRRPVVDGGEAAESAGAPLLGSPRLPDDPNAGAHQAPGLGALVLRLYGEDGAKQCAFVSCRGSEAEAKLVAVLAVEVLARRGPVILVTSAADAPDEVAFHEHDPAVEVLDDSSPVRGADGVPMVIDGVHAADGDVPQRVLPRARCALIVREGVRDAAVKEAAAQFADGQLSGVVFVPRRRWRARR